MKKTVTKPKAPFGKDSITVIVVYCREEDTLNQINITLSFITESKVKRIIAVGSFGKFKKAIEGKRWKHKSSRDPLDGVEVEYELSKVSASYWNIASTVLELRMGMGLDQKGLEYLMEAYDSMDGNQTIYMNTQLTYKQTSFVHSLLLICLCYLNLLCNVSNGQENYRKEYVCCYQKDNQPLDPKKDSKNNLRVLSKPSAAYRIERITESRPLFFEMFRKVMEKMGLFSWLAFFVVSAIAGSFWVFFYMRTYQIFYLLFTMRIQEISRSMVIGVLVFQFVASSLFNQFYKHYVYIVGFSGEKKQLDNSVWVQLTWVFFAPMCWLFFAGATLMFLVYDSLFGKGPERSLKVKIE